jgi:predicted SAM-dependent methyltransferase
VSQSLKSSVRTALKRVPFLTKLVQHLRRQRQSRETASGWERYASDHKTRGLNIGSSNTILKDWFNVDYFAVYQNQFFMDATVRFPMPDDSLDYIRSEHMIEHVPYLSAMDMLRECRRVLRPGGIVRVATPDLDKLARLYDSPRSSEQQRYVDSVLGTWRRDYASSEVGVAINNIFLFENHYFIFDEGTLGEALAKAGFVDVVVSSPGQSTHDFLRGTDIHATDDDYITFETLTMEARKPA